MKGMVFFTRGDLEGLLWAYAEEYSLDFKDKTVNECISIIRDKFQIKTTQELYVLAEQNLEKIYSTFSFKGLRIFYYSFIKDDNLKSFVGDDPLEQKYYRLIKDIKKYHHGLLVGVLEYQLEYYLYCFELETAYKNEYGVLNTKDVHLYSLLKTIDYAFYDEEVILALHSHLYNLLKGGGDKYYIRKDLTDPDNIRMLFNHVAEENFDGDVVKGPGLIDYDDGYGNREYYEYDSTSNDDGSTTSTIIEGDRDIGCFIKEW